MRPTRPVLALALLLPACADTARAASPPPLPCYGRSYDAAHRRAHPRQRVEAVQLARSGEPAPMLPAGTSVWHLALRIGADTFRGVAECRGGRCVVEGDGGAFTLRPAGRALMLRVGARLVLEGERDASPDLGGSADDRVFRLQPSPPAGCTAARP